MLKDFHLHTNFSDGENTIEEMAKTALGLGIKEIAITDHIWATSDWFKQYCLEVRRVRENIDIKINIGFEAKALSVNGEIDASDEMQINAEIKIGAIHRIPKNFKLMDYFSKEDALINPDLVYSKWLLTTINLIKNHYVDIVAHPFMAIMKYDITPLLSDVLRVMDLAVQYGTLLELSYRYRYTNLYLLNVLKEYPKYLSIISYGSDSHSVVDLENSIKCKRIFG